MSYIVFDNPDMKAVSREVEELSDLCSAPKLDVLLDQAKQVKICMVERWRGHGKGAYVGYTADLASLLGDDPSFTAIRRPKTWEVLFDVTLPSTVVIRFQGTGRNFEVAYIRARGRVCAMHDGWDIPRKYRRELEAQ